MPPPRALDRYGDWLLFVPALLILNTALLLLSLRGLFSDFAKVLS